MQTRTRREPTRPRHHEEAALREAPRAMSPTALLALQRTAGNQAVARLVQGRALQRMPVSGADPGSDLFWPELAAAAETQLTCWLENDYNLAIDQFESDLTGAEAGGGSGEFLLDTFLTLLGFAPGGDIAGAVIEIAKGIYEQLPTSTPVDLPTFLEQARANKIALARAVCDREVDLFSMLDDARAREGADQADVAAREAAAAQVSTAIAQLPTWKQMRQALSVDWVNSSTDSWDFDSEAGTIMFSVDIAEESGDFQWIAPRIDDASRPEGVIQALNGAFGSDTPLELLPIEMVASATFSPSGRRARFVNPRAAVPALRDGPCWTLESGDDSAIASWEQQRARPTVGDLVP